MLGGGPYTIAEGLSTIMIANVLGAGSGKGAPVVHEESIESRLYRTQWERMIVIVLKL